MAVTDVEAMNAAHRALDEPGDYVLVRIGKVLQAWPAKHIDVISDWSDAEGRDIAFAITGNTEPVDGETSRHTVAYIIPDAP